MCWMCDHPGSSQLDYFDRLRATISEYGWAVQGVERDGPHPPWAYTIGLTEHDRPELVVTGRRLDAATRLLNQVASHVLHAQPPVPGERIPWRGGPLMEIVELPHPDAHLEFAVAFYGDRLRALQLVCADDRGHWPWDAGFRGGRGGQPVLGPRTAVHR